MVVSVSDNSKRIGRPYWEGELVGVRFWPDQLAALGAFAASEPDDPSRPETVRRLVARALTDRAG